MNNVVYVDFKQREVVQLESLRKQRDQLYRLMNDKLTFKQFQLTRANLGFAPKYVDIAHEVIKISKSFQLKKIASELIDVCDAIELIKKVG